MRTRHFLFTSFGLRCILNLATLQPCNLATSQPRNLATSQPRNLATSQPRKLATSQTRNLATRTFFLFPFFFQLLYNLQKTAIEKSVKPKLISYWFSRQVQLKHLSGYIHLIMEKFSRVTRSSRRVSSRSLVTLFVRNPTT
jgi:hypothetical protein